MEPTELLGAGDVFADFGAAGPGGVYAGTGLDDVGYGYADEEGKAGDDLEIEQGFAARLAYFFEVAHGGDAQGDGEEDDGVDEELDDADEAFAQEFHLYGPFGIDNANDNAGGDGEQYPEGEAFQDRFGGGAQV